MASLALFMAVLLAITGYSSAAYCVCNTGLSDSVLQKNIDYACGYGADCGQISQNGACFNPNTVKDHCNFAVNSYFQKKGQVQGSCDFSGTAMVSQTPPAGAISACFSSTSTPTPTGTSTPTPPGTGIMTPPPGIATPPPVFGTTTPPPAFGTTTPPPGTGTTTPPPGTGIGTGTTTPGTGTGTGTGTGLGTGTGAGTGAPGISVNPVLGPTGTNGYDNSDSVSIHQITKLLTPASVLVLGFIWFRLI